VQRTRREVVFEERVKDVRLDDLDVAPPLQQSHGAFDVEHAAAKHPQIALGRVGGVLEIEADLALDGLDVGVREIIVEVHEEAVGGARLRVETARPAAVLEGDLLDVHLVGGRGRGEGGHGQGKHSEQRQRAHGRTSG
jgi:hypothetical protein